MTELHAKAVRATVPAGNGAKCELTIDNAVKGILHINMSERNAYIYEETLEEMIRTLKEEKNGN